MCGIAGTIDFQNPPNRDVLEKMSLHLKNRGPDNLGIYQDEVFGLVHRRLSIIDLSESANQPLFNEDKTLAVVCNGEIYNYRSIQAQLKKAGHHFSSESDTEVLIHLYEEKGVKMLHELHGMFAFAIADLKKKQLFIARDRFGQKPLFYSALPDGNIPKQFAFASGPAALQELDWISNEIDDIGLHEYFELQYVPSPRSIYKSIKRLPPACYAILSDKEFSVNSYWKANVNGLYQGSYKDAKEELKEKFFSAVKRRLVSDVPLGLFLSGGMDSSLICAVVKNIADSDSNIPIPETYSIGFSDKEYDESEYASQVADFLGLKHHSLEVDPSSFQFLKRIVSAYEEPFADASMLPTALLSEFTRRDVKAVLSGDGADEFFGGYYRYRLMHLYKALDFVPISIRKPLTTGILKILPSQPNERTFRGILRRLVKISANSGIERYIDIISRFSEKERFNIYGERMLDSLTSRKNSLKDKIILDEHSIVDAIMELDIKTYLPNDILVKVDRASMEFGLEVRAPFLDHELAQFAMSLPYKWKQKGSRRKIILHDTFKEMLPESIFSRRKKGFGVPLASWFRSSWYKPTRELLLNGSAVKQRFFNKRNLESLLYEHSTGKRDWSYAIFAMLVFEIWLSNKTLC